MRRPHLERAAGLAKAVTLVAAIIGSKDAIACLSIALLQQCCVDAQSDLTGPRFFKYGRSCSTIFNCRDCDISALVAQVSQLEAALASKTSEVSDQQARLQGHLGSISRVKEQLQWCMRECEALKRQLTDKDEQIARLRAAAAASAGASDSASGQGLGRAGGAGLGQPGASFTSGWAGRQRLPCSMASYVCSSGCREAVYRFGMLWLFIGVCIYLLAPFAQTITHPVRVALLYCCVLLLYYPLCWLPSHQVSGLLFIRISAKLWLGRPTWQAQLVICTRAPQQPIHEFLTACNCASLPSGGGQWSVLAQHNR